MLRDPFEQDAAILAWLQDSSVAGSPQEADASPPQGAYASPPPGAYSNVEAWASTPTPDLGLLANWLQGLRFPGFDARETSPAEHLLRSIPQEDARTWNVITAGMVDLLVMPDPEVIPLLRHPLAFWTNLFSLAGAIGPEEGLPRGLDHAYRSAEERYGREDESDFDSEGKGGLVEAMIRNQVDDRWKSIWYGYLNGREHPDDFEMRGHPFLPGRFGMGMRGLLGRGLEAADYWIEIARGIREVERRFLLGEQDTPNCNPNLMDELVKLLGVVFTRRPEPETARLLFKASLDLATEGSWSMYAAAAWSVAVENRKGWSGALWLQDDPDRRAFIDTFAAGLQLFADWEKQGHDVDPPSAGIEETARWASHQAKAA